jgi:pimeloyl-ACP methyl ester carboxylesterase
MHVVLVHGMGRTPLSMLLLRYRLGKAGHQVYLFGYLPMFEGLAGATTRLQALVARKVGSNAYALVGHSLGSVIIRHALAKFDQPPTACLLLAPPMLACKAAKFFSRFYLYRRLTGEMGQLLADDRFMQQLPLLPNTKIYAGIGGPRAAWLPFGVGLNDGVLSLVEATGSAAVEVLQVPSMHTLIMNSKRVFADMARELNRLDQSNQRLKNR